MLVDVGIGANPLILEEDGEDLDRGQGDVVDHVGGGGENRRAMAGLAGHVTDEARLTQLLGAEARQEQPIADLHRFGDGHLFGDERFEEEGGGDDDLKLIEDFRPVEGEAPLFA